MAQKRNALGRGLDALLSMDEVQTEGSSSINEIELSKIAVNPNATDLIGLRLGQIIPEDGKGLLIDNLFVYGTSEMEKNDIIKVNYPGSQTADVSVLCYAAAAVAGLGSLVIAKKK